MNNLKGVRGKIATNVPEIELIKLVKMRPLLYDKNEKNYRKPGVSEQAWSEIASALNTSTLNCKKRWKSLRDTFLKYSHLNVKFETKRRRWLFYNDLKFLQPHIELFRQESQKEENIPIHLRENIHDEKHFFFEEESSPEDDDIYEIKIDQGNEELEPETLIEQTDPYPNLDESDGADKSGQSTAEYLIMEESNLASKSDVSEREASEVANELTTQNITDPDEQYLLSCLPMLKRLPPHKKALLRIGIEKLFYEIEFEPPIKRFKDS